MLVIGTFEHSIELEQLLAVLEQSGIQRKHIMVVAMDAQPKCCLNPIGRPKDVYTKGFEVGMAFATGISVIGTSVGFVLPLGPVVWGLAAGFFGFALGFGLYYFFNRKSHTHLPKKLPEVTVIVQCTETQANHVMDSMWKYRVLTVGQFPHPT